MFRRPRPPEWAHITDRQRAQIAADRDARATAREALISATQHLEADEAFDLLTAQYAARVDPATLHHVLQRHERAVDALKTETDRLDCAEKLARRAWEME